jgi:uncharacterized protein
VHRSLIGAWRLLVLASVSSLADAQTLRLSPRAATSPAALDADIARLARALLRTPLAGDSLRVLSDRAALQLAVRNADAAVATLTALRARPDAPSAASNPGLVTLYLQARASQQVSRRGLSFVQAYREVFRQEIRQLGDRDSYEVAWALETPLAAISRGLADAVQRGSAAASITRDEAIALVRQHVRERGVASVQRALPALIAADVDARYATDTSILIRAPSGVTLSAIVVRPRKAVTPQPTALQFDIYTDMAIHLADARLAASHGYVGVVADARGKRLSRDSIRPFETETEDTHAVLDWIAAQPWSDGRVGMYGASYGGFSAWAATKRPHPALRTIAVYAAAMPGLGLPMENNVFVTANYAWPFYVGNNRTLDQATYGDQTRWQTLPERWYRSGQPYRQIDQVDGTPNHMLQEWLRHPAFDAYWQAMVPFGADYARISIPVLSVTGYLDDGQISAIEYVQQHLHHRPVAAHYLVIGPYDHFGAAARRKPVVLRGYATDPVAQFSGPALTFAWFDHVLRGAPRPALVGDRINHQVMGSNRWRHAPSLDAVSTERRRLYLSAARDGGDYRLTDQLPASGTLSRTVSLNDRTTQNNGYYPEAIIRTDRDFGQALTFVSAPITEPMELSGSFSGALRVVVNSRDFDFNVVLYEVMPDGRLFHLSYFVGRASFAQDMSTRQMLVPGDTTMIPFTRTRMTSRLLSPGSRLLVVFDVNKDAYHQVNHGTGADVSDESATDAREPLVLSLLPGSMVELPLRRP